MVIYIDIDDTICETNGTEYNKAIPIKKAIEKANQLYDKNHEIIYWTARGTKTGINWRKVTEKQFEEWGVKYNKLIFGKPAYDLFIDDKNMNSNEWWKKIDI